MNPKQTPRRSVNFKTLTSLNSASAHGIHDVVQAPLLPKPGLPWPTLACKQLGPRRRCMQGEM